MSNEKVARSVALEQAYVHDVYEQFSDNPRSRPWPRVQEFIEGLEPGSIVCDVGCGNGKYLNVSTSVFNIGGEKCQRLSGVAREKENEVLILDNLALPFRDESMDAVLSIAVVHHFATTERRVCALRELARVLRIGGRLIISVWAMEQSHRKFESQDVLVPWHRPHHLSTPSLELTSTTTTSEEDCHNISFHAYSLTSDNESSKTNKTRKRGKTRNRNRSINTPNPNSSPGSSSLSSPNETCYSFVRRAIQKLAGGRRAGVHRPWFLDPFTNCAKDPPPKRYDPDGCECCECENAQDLPIELRRVDDDEIPQQRRQTFPSTQLINDLYNIKSRSMSNMHSNNDSVDTASVSSIIRSNSSLVSVEEKSSDSVTVPKKCKPKLVKQKKSICEDDDKTICTNEEAEEALDKPTEIQQVLPDIRIERSRHLRASVQKQRSLNEELMSTDRLQEKEKLRRHIHKQASLNEDLIFQRQYSFDNIRDTTAKRLQLIKNKIKSTNIERVTGSSLRNGFVRMFQNWKNSNELISPTTTTIPEHESVILQCNLTQQPKNKVCERRQSKEDGSDSSKDSSLQSDTSVDSEDSFASVIFVPKSNPMSPTMTLSPGPNSSVPSSPRIKQSSCPTSPRIKQMPLSVYPLTKQLSSPKPSSVAKLENLSPTDKKIKTPIPTLAQKYSVQPIPKFKKSITNNNNNSVKPTAVSNNNTSVNTKSEEDDKLKAIKDEKLQTIKNLLNSKPGFGMRISKHTFPIVRHSSVNNGKVQSIAKPLPKLLSLELFNPETDDKDSDSSAVSSPDSVDSVISISCVEKKQTFTFPDVSDDDLKRSIKKNLNVLEEEDDETNLDSEKETLTVGRTDSFEKRKLNDLSTSDPKKLNALTESIEHWNLSSSKQTESLGNRLDCKNTQRNLSVSQTVSLDHKSPSLLRTGSTTKRRHLSLLERTNSVDLRNFNVNPSDKHKLEPSSSSSSVKKNASLNPSDHQHLSLLEAASDVANSLDKTVDKVIKSSPRSKRRELKTVDVRSVIDRNYATDLLQSEDWNEEYQKNKHISDLNKECQKHFNEECQKHLSDFSNWNEECHKHLSDFADKLSEKLLHEIDQYQEKIRIRQEAGTSLEHIDDPYINRLSEELQDLSKLSAEIQKQNEYLAKLSANDMQFGCSKCKQLTCTCRRKRKNVLKTAKYGKADELQSLKIPEDFQGARSEDTAQEINKSVDSCDSENSNSNSLNFGHSIESTEGTEKDANFGYSNESDKDTASINFGSDKDTNSVNFGHSIESDKDTNSVSKYSDGGSTASLASCPEWKTIKTKLSEHPAKVSSSSFDEKSELSIRHSKEKSNLIPSLSDTSQESLPSDNIGGEITYHRYYHVFRKGELDQLIEKYVENLHIISSYYDHASWCVVAEKVQVWTI